MIYLYESTTTDFIYNGQPFPKTYEVTVDRTINDEFFVTGKHPLDENNRYKLIQKDKIIKAHTPDGMQPFRIMDVNKRLGYVEFEAWPLLYADLRNKLIKPFKVTNSSGQSVLNTFINNLLLGTNFSFTSNILSTHDFSVRDESEAQEDPNQLYDALEVFKRIVNRWSGELIINGYDIRLVSRLGKNTDALLYEKKNITDFVDKESIQGIVTRVHGKSEWTEDGPDGKQLTKRIKTTVDSPLINAYSGIVFEQQFTNNDIRTEQELKNWLNLKFSTENIDKPSRTIELDTNIVDETEVALGDKLNLKYLKHDVDMLIRMTKYQYDGFNNKYIKIFVGDALEHFTGSVQNTISIVETNIKNSVDKTIAHVIVNQLGQKIIYSEYEPEGDYSEGDIWFDNKGGMYFWDEASANWIPHPFNNRVDVVEQEVKKHTDEIATVTQSANDAVTKADQAIEDADFIKLDVAQVKSDALTTASTAQSAYNNAISALSKADTAISTTDNFSLLVNDLEQSVTFKADSSRVDTLSGKVDSQSLLIQANADALIYKADKTSVDTINQTVNQHTNDISINAQAINARLTSTQVDSLVAAKNYVNSNTLVATANGLNLSIAKVSSNAKNISGYNLLERELIMPYASGILISDNYETTGTITYERGNVNNEGFYIDRKTIMKNDSKYSLKFSVRQISGAVTETLLYNSLGHSMIVYVDGEYVISSNASQFSISLNLTDGLKHDVVIDITTSTNLETTNYSYLGTIIQFNKGNNVAFKIEMNALRLEASDTILEQFTTLDATVNGIQTTVGTKASQSQVTQIASQVSTKVESSTYNSKMTQLDSSINLRVTKAELISQINIQSNNILIQSGKLYLDAASVVFSGSAFIPSAAITSLTVDKLNGGTANFANFNAININVSSLVGNTTDFIQSNWNKANTSLSVNAAGLTSVSGALLTTLNAGSITTVSGTKTGTVNALGMQISDSSSGWTTKLYSDGLEFQWYGVIRGITQTSEGLEIKPTTGSGARLNSALALTTGPGNDKIAYLQLANPDGGTNSRLEMNGTQLSLRHPNGGSLDIADYAYNGQLGRINSGKFRTTTTDGRGIQMEVSQISVLAGNQTIYIMPSGTGELRIGNGSANPTLWPIRASQFIQGSSRDSKTNINDYTGNALNELSQLKVVTYNRKDDLARGVDYLSLGFIAEDSPAIAVYNVGMPAGVDQYKMVSLAIKGIQELDQKVISIGNNANVSNTLASRAFSEMQQLKNKVTELEFKIQKLESAA